MARNKIREVSKKTKPQSKTRSATDRKRKKLAGTEKVCPNCSSVDIYSIIDEEYTEVTHSTLSEAATNVNCVFCRFVVQFSITKYGTLDESMLQSTVCTLGRWYVLFDEQYRQGGLMYYAEFQLMIKLEHRCPYTPCDGASCLNETNRLEYKTTNLDLLEMSPSILTTSVPSTVARKRLDPIFNPEKLLSWLRRSELDELQRSPSIENKASSLDALFHANRFRVLDIETSEIVVLRYLTRYLALSYVWGNVGHCSSALNRQSCCNNSFSAHECATSVDVKQLPWTIQDSIGLLKRIGERYLWVDALCISQGDLDDKAAIIPEMGAIYGNAYLTIVAADGSHSNDRLSRLVNGEPPEEWIPITTRLGETLLSPARPTIDQAMAHSTWNMRGWTFQERVLSRRCVLFTKYGVYFDCRILRASEAYELVPNGHNGASLGLSGDAYDAFHSDRGSRLGNYATVLAAYSKRKLSHRGDRLDAFTGILRHLQPQGMSVEQIEALSGLPLRDFISSLHWSGQVKPRDSYRLKAGLPKQLKPLRKMNRLILDARRSHYLPSWSWSGWEGFVVFDDSVVFLTDPKVLVWHGLAEPTVINAANIVCYTPYSPTNFEPELSPVTKPLRVMLHMWVKAWPCSLVPKTQQGTDTIYTVEPRRLQTDILQDEDEENEVILPEGVDPSSTFELLCLHDKSQRYILVREVDSFMERVDLVYHPYLRRLSNEFVVKYVRLC